MKPLAIRGASEYIVNILFCCEALTASLVGANCLATSGRPFNMYTIDERARIDPAEK